MNISSHLTGPLPNLTCDPLTNSTHPDLNCPPTASSPQCDSFGDNSDKVRFAVSLIVSLCIVVCSAPPAIAIWRTQSLHRPSYFYVMVLCLMDCVLGGSIFLLSAILTPFIPFVGQIPDAGCIVYEVLLNSTLNAINGMMLALSRDRYRSMRSPFRYRAAARSAVVWRHWATAIIYGLVHGGVIWVGARLFFGSYSIMLGLTRCDTFEWLLKPEYRPVAIIAVTGNVLIDFGTITYNAMILRLAIKASRQLEGQSIAQLPCEEAQRKRNMKMVVFTFKLACLFLICSLPYKLALLSHGLGFAVPREVVEFFGMIRMLYHIVDGWMVCTNEELLKAMKKLLSWCSSSDSE